MGFHHVARATRDTAAAHRFHTEVVGFERLHDPLPPLDQDVAVRLHDPIPEPVAGI